MLDTSWLFSDGTYLKMSNSAWRYIAFRISCRCKRKFHAVCPKELGKVRFIKWVVWRPSVKTMTHWFSHEFTDIHGQDQAELPNSPSVPRPQRRDVAFASGESQREVELTTPTLVDWFLWDLFFSAGTEQMGCENPNSDGFPQVWCQKPMACYDLTFLRCQKPRPRFAQASGKRDSSEWSGRTKRPFMLKTWLKPRMNKPFGLVIN